MAEIEVKYSATLKDGTCLPEVVKRHVGALDCPEEWEEECMRFLTDNPEIDMLDLTIRLKAKVEEF